jgi:hypothetical protein
MDCHCRRSTNSAGKLDPPRATTTVRDPMLNRRRSVVAVPWMTQNAGGDTAGRRSRSGRCCTEYCTPAYATKTFVLPAKVGTPSYSTTVLPSIIPVHASVQHRPILRYVVSMPLVTDSQYIYVHQNVRGTRCNGTQIESMWRHRTIWILSCRPTNLRRSIAQ